MTNRALFAFGNPDDDDGDQKFDASPGQSYPCTLRSTSGVSSWQLQVYDATAYNPALPILGNPPRKSKNAPDITLTGTSSGSMVSALTPLSAIDIATPAIESVAHSWIVRSVVNGGMSGSPPRPDRDLVHERIIALAPNGIRKPVVSELRQYEDDSWAGVVCDIIDELAAGPGDGGDGLPAGTPGDLLYVNPDDEWAMLPIGPLGYHLVIENGGSGEPNQPAWHAPEVPRPISIGDTLYSPDGENWERQPASEDAGAAVSSLAQSPADDVVLTLLAPGHTAGFYRISGYLEVVTAPAGGTTAPVISYTSTSLGARTLAMFPSPQSLTPLGPVNFYSTSVQSDGTAAITLAFGFAGGGAGSVNCFGAARLA